MSRASTKKKYSLEFAAESLLPDDRLAKPQDLLAHFGKGEECSVRTSTVQRLRLANIRILDTIVIESNPLETLTYVLELNIPNKNSSLHSQRVTSCCSHRLLPHRLNRQT